MLIRDRAWTGGEIAKGLIRFYDALRKIAASVATDCGPSCLRSRGGEEGSSRPSGFSFLQGWASTNPQSSQMGRLPSNPSPQSRDSGFVQSVARFVGIRTSRSRGLLVRPIKALETCV